MKHRVKMEARDRICEACGGSQRAMERPPAPGDTSAVGTFPLQCNVYIVSCAAGGLSPYHSTMAGALDQQVSEQKAQRRTRPIIHP